MNSVSNLIFLKSLEMVDYVKWFSLRFGLLLHPFRHFVYLVFLPHQKRIVTKIHTSRLTTVWPNRCLNHLLMSFRAFVSCTNHIFFEFSFLFSRLHDLHSLWSNTRNQQKIQQIEQQSQQHCMHLMRPQFTIISRTVQ